MKWSEIEIVDKDDKVLSGPAARKFVEEKCPQARIQTVLKESIRVFSETTNKEETGAEYVEEFLSDQLTGKVKDLRFSKSDKRGRGSLVVARGNPNVADVNTALLEMYLDSDRDGHIDKLPVNFRKWTWGPDGRGGVVLVRNRTYLAGDVVLERTPIEFRWKLGRPKPQNWQATLSEDVPNRIRIFRHKTEGAAQVNLPCDLAALGPEDDPRIYRLWIEATDYPNSQTEADWQVALELALTCNGRERKRQRAVVRIAPWIMASDLDQTKKVYIVDFGASNNIKNGQVIINNQTVRTGVARHCLGGTTLAPVTVGLQGLGRYLRDAMRFGTHVVPAQPHPIALPVVLRGNNQTTQHVVPSVGIDRQNDGIGYTSKGALTDSDLQTGGNMMVSPPVANYPWGRIICGSEGKGGLGPWEYFLKAQRVQKPILIDTDWLSVGHSDEIIAFVPKVGAAPAGGSNFRMLVTSPRLGYQLLEQSGINWATVDLARTNHDGPYSNYQATFAAHNFPNGVDMQQHIASDPALAYVGDNGEGRMGFRRFSNSQVSLHTWLDDFLARDELITKFQGGEVALRTEHLRELNAWFGTVAAPVPPRVNRSYTSLRNAITQYQTGGFETLSLDGKNFLRNGIRPEITRLRALPAPRALADTRRLGLLLLSDHPDIRNLREAHQLLSSIGDPVAGLFPTPTQYLTACTQIWNLAQPAIDQLVRNAPINTNQPDLQTIFNALQIPFAAHGINAPTWAALNSTLRDNMVIQTKLAVIVKTLKAELGIGDADIINVPILYTGFPGAKTHVADMVNFLMLSTPGASLETPATACTCIVPKPYGPIVNGIDIYERYFQQQLATLGITTIFLDEWYEYHLNDGEIHCGTNQLPETTVASARKKWWLHQPR